MGVIRSVFTSEKNVFMLFFKIEISIGETIFFGERKHRMDHCQNEEKIIPFEAADGHRANRRLVFYSYPGADGRARGYSVIKQSINLLGTNKANSVIIHYI